MSILLQSKALLVISKTRKELYKCQSIPSTLYKMILFIMLSLANINCFETSYSYI